MSNVREIQSPYRNLGEAAAFCRKAKSTFRAYVRKYRIPKKGPSGDLFLVDDLQKFMDNPFCFIIPPKDTPRGNAPYKPIVL